MWTPFSVPSALYEACNSLWSLSVDALFRAFRVFRGPSVLYEACNSLWSLSVDGVGWATFRDRVFRILNDPLRIFSRGPSIQENREIRHPFLALDRLGGGD